MMGNPAAPTPGAIGGYQPTGHQPNTGYTPSGMGGDNSQPSGRRRRPGDNPSQNADSGR